MTAHAKSSLEVVEEWKKKCYDFFTQSDDPLVSTMLRLLEASSVILKGHDHSRVQRALAFLEYERSLNAISENNEEPSIRTMMFGVLQSIHGTLLDMTSSKYSTSSAETQTEEISNFTFLVEPKEELMDFKEEDMMEPFVVPNYYNELPVKPKDESIDEFQDFHDDNQILNEFDPILREDNNDITNKVEMNGTGESEVEGKDSSAENAIAKEVEKKVSIGKSKNIQQKRKSSNKEVSKSEPAMKKRQSKNRNTTDLKCSECNYCTRSVDAWFKHLRYDHSTTPTQAGLALLCDCGFESFSVEHASECDVSNFTIIPKSDIPSTPQCVMCQMFPKSVYAYAQHLLHKHNYNLNMKDIYLKCSCGLEIFESDCTKLAEHCKKCDSSQFTLHKLEEEE